MLREVDFLKKFSRLIRLGHLCGDYSYFKLV